MKRAVCLVILSFLLAGILYAQADSTKHAAANLPPKWETRALLMDPLGIPRVGGVADSTAGGDHSQMWLAGHPQVLSAINLSAIEQEAQRWIRYRERMEAMRKDSLAHRPGVRITYPDRQ